MKPSLGMIVHPQKVMPLLSSVLMLIGFSNLVCRDQPWGHHSGPSAPSGCPLVWSLHTRCENPWRNRLPQVLLQYFYTIWYVKLQKPIHKQFTESSLSFRIWKLRCKCVHFRKLLTKPQLWVADTSVCRVCISWQINSTCTSLWLSGHVFKSTYPWHAAWDPGPSDVGSASPWLACKFRNTSPPSSLRTASSPIHGRIPHWRWTLCPLPGCYPREKALWAPVCPSFSNTGEQFHRKSLTWDFARERVDIFWSKFSGGSELVPRSGSWNRGSEIRIL